MLEHKVPPPLVALACAAAMYWLARHTPAAAISGHARLALAAVVGSAGLAVMLAGVVSFRVARTTVNPLKPESATALVTSGVFRYTRNPMYLGMLAILLAWAMFLASPAALLGVAAFWLYIQRFQIQPEEKALAALFGSAFADYMARVRRWL